MSKIREHVAVALGMLLCAQTVWAQEYPTRPVRIVVPSSPGGGTDILARPMAAKLTERWGQQVMSTTVRARVR